MSDNTDREELEPREIVRVEQRTQTDCLRCCLAMVTAIDYDDVPDFVADYGESWPAACETWLSELGMGLLMMPTAPTYVPPWLPIIARGSTEYPDVHHFVVVTSNAVIDPSPSQHRLKEAAATYAVINSPLRRAAVVAPQPNIVRENLEAIIIRCTDGDPSYDWRKTITRLAREALDAIPVAAPRGDAVDYTQAAIELGRYIVLGGLSDAAVRDVASELERLLAPSPAAPSLIPEPCGYCASPDHFSAAAALRSLEGLPDVEGLWHRSSGGGYYRCTAVTPATATAAELVDREEAAKMAFDAIKAALQGDWTNHYSVLQIAGMVAANIRRLSPVAATSGAREQSRSALDEIEVALISIADGVNPADAVQKAFEIINRERQKMIG